MAVLSNGIETIELGATAWRVLINANFEKLYTKAEIEAIKKTIEASVEAATTAITAAQEKITALENRVSTLETK